MATLAEMFTGAALEQNASNRDQNPGSGFAVGAQIAQHAEQLKQQRAELQQKQQQLQLAKLDKAAGWFEAAGKMEDGAAKQAFLKNYIPNGIDALGLSDAFHPDSLKMMQGSPMVVPYVKNEITQGRLDPSELYGALAQPDKMAALMNRPGFKQFGAMEDVKGAIQDSIGSIVKEADTAAKYKQALAAAGVRSAPMGERTIVSQHKDALNELTSPSSPITKQFGAAKSIDNSYKAFVHSGGLPQEWEQFQTQLRLNQGSTGGRTGVNERANAHASDLGITAQQYVQIVTGNPQDVGLTSKKLVEAMKAVGKIEMSQLKTQAIESIDTLASGRQDFYNNEGKSKSGDYYRKVKSLKEQIGNTGGDLSSDEKPIYKGKNKAWLQSFLKDHPNDPEVPNIKKALGE